jgi:hypothetical protein
MSKATLDSTEITPVLWRKIKISLQKPDGFLADLEIASPLWWVGDRKVGDVLNVEIHDLGLEGIGRILEISSFNYDSQNNPTGSNLVIGTIRHRNATLLDLEFEHLTDSKLLGVTATHPIFSEDRGRFIPAGELNFGEQIRTLVGTVTLTSKIARCGVYDVYNLEVHREHVFLVTQFGILTHNAILGCSPTAEKLLNVVKTEAKNVDTLGVQALTPRQQASLKKNPNL